jgi:hypothetical protein
VQAPKCKLYLRGGYLKRPSLLEIAKLKGSYTCASIFIQKYHHQLDAYFVVNDISTLVINNLSMMVASVQEEIKLHYKNKTSYDKA